MNFLQKILQQMQLQNAAIAQNRASSKTVRYLVSPKNWSIRHDGECLMANLPKPIGEITTISKGVHNGIFHYGGVADALSRGRLKRPDAKLPCGLTWFHVLDNDKRLKLVKAMDRELQFWHSSCSSTRDTLVANGANPDKFHVIPLGVDCEIFKPAADEEKKALRLKYAIPEDAVVIGSFQKDGMGWNYGAKPKWEKGPDTLCDALVTLSKNYPIFAVLSGPARGFVKECLDAASVPYFHAGFLDHANDTAELYQLLDLYLISSRIEGGPKSALEAPASGVPLVATKVGMVPDLFTHKVTAMMCDPEDSAALAAAAETVIESIALQTQLREQGRALALANSWRAIAARYYQELYLPFL